MDRRASCRPAFAFDLPLPDRGRMRGAGRGARAARTASQLDINLVRASRRRKKLLVADMDSTIINVECLDELADMAGLKPKIAAITERAMRGELEFEAALRERVGMLKGLPAGRAGTHLCRARAAQSRREIPHRHHAGAWRPHACWSPAASAISPAASPRPRAFMPSAATRCSTTAKALTGEVGTPILGREAKLEALEEAVAQLGIDFAESLAVGDGANDLAMIQTAPGSGRGLSRQAGRRGRRRRRHQSQRSHGAALSAGLSRRRIEISRGSLVLTRTFCERSRIEQHAAGRRSRIAASSVAIRHK